MSKFEPKLVVQKQPKSNFNLSRVNRFSCHPGMIIPVAWEEVLPDDTFTFDMEAVLKTNALLSPVLGSFKVAFHAFFCPDRLYIKDLQRNKFAKLGQPLIDVKLPFVNLPSIGPGDYIDIGGGFPRDIVDPLTVKQGTLLDYLGVPPGFVNLSFGNFEKPVRVNALPILSYYDIVRHYFAHEQSGVMSIHTDNYESADAIFNPIEFKLEDFDVYMDQIYNNYSQGGGVSLSNFSCVSKNGANYDITNPKGRYGGICNSTYMPDQFMNYLDNDVIAQIRSTAKVMVQDWDVQEGANITIDDLRFANHLHRYLELNLLGGRGRFSDWLRATWAVDIDTGIYRPEYLGSMTTWLQFQDVVSQSNTLAQDAGANDLTGLGELGGRGFGHGKGKKRKFHFNENGTFMVLMTMVPEIDYGQGLRKSLCKTMWSDKFVPQLDGIGFQDISLSEVVSVPNYATLNIGTVQSPEYVDGYSAWSSLTVDENVDPLSLTIGKQPAWMEYMTAQNEVHGRLVPSGDLAYWVLGVDWRGVRYYGQNVPDIGFDYTHYQFTPYVNPYGFQYLFASTGADDDNFIVQFKLDLIAKRRISKNIRPSL